MIIKEKDDSKDVLHRLDELKKISLSAKQRFLVDREIKMFAAGVRGEKTSAYFLDFEWGNSENWGIIHDLRIEHEGRIAQIDHLLINRYLEIYVLETKNFSYGVKINDHGEFNVWSGKGYTGIESPIEQNNRHIRVLEKAVKDRGLAPSRLGRTIPTTFHPFVLMSPTSRIDRAAEKKYNTKNVIKSDQFSATIFKSFDEASVGLVFGRVAKIVGKDTLKKFSQSIAKLHRPIAVDYRAKFGITAQPDSTPDVTTVQETLVEYERPAAITAQNSTKPEPNPDRCDKCGVDVASKVVYYCRFNRTKLGGHKILCQQCQREVGKSNVMDTESAQPAEKGTGTCEKCTAVVSSKVVAYCRFNRKKLGRFKTLCPTCQKTV